MFYQHQHFGTSDYFCKEHGRNFNFPKHIHRSFELIAVTNGQMTVTVDDEVYVLGSGESVLIFPNQIHSLESSDCEHHLVIFSQDVVMAYYTRHTDEVPICNKLILPEHLLLLLQTISEKDSSVKKKGLLYSVCAAVDDNTEYKKRPYSGRELLHLIFEYVESNYERDCSLGGLSATLGYSESYLSRYFGKITGASFVSFVNRYRISKACYLLKNTKKSILECSFDCGYSSLRSFNRNFSKYVAMTPQEYRNNN